MNEVNMDRFQPPSASEQIAAEWRECDSCGERTHYEELDREGICENCREEIAYEND